MAALTNVKRLYGCRGRALDTALNRLYRWLEDNTLLLWAYVLFLIGCVFAIFHDIAHYFFLSLVIPLVFLKAVQLDASRSFSARLSLSRVLKFGTTISLILSAAGIYLVMLILSSALQQPTDGIEKFLQVSVLSFEIIALLLVTALLILSSNVALRACLTVVAVAAAANALIALIVFVSSTPLNQLLNHRLGDAGWPPGARLGVASLAINSGIFLVASVAILSEAAGRLWHRILVASSALTLTCALLLTQSRSMYLAAGAGIAATLTWSSRSIRRAAVAAPVVLILVLVFITTVPAVIEMMLKRGDSRRLEIWSHYINLAWEQPWLGYGSMKNIHFEAKDGLDIVHPHNLILSAQVRGGVLATGALIVILLGGLYYSARYAKLTGQRAPLGIMVTLIVAGLFDYELLVVRSFPNWQTLPFWFPIGICVGTELYVRARHNSEPGAIAP